MDHTSNNRVHHKSGINNVFPTTLQITAQFRAVPATADPREWGGRRQVSSGRQSHHQKWQVLQDSLLNSSFDVLISTSETFSGTIRNTELRETILKELGSYVSQCGA